MKELIIKKNESGQRLDKFLKKYLDKSGSAFIYKMLRKKNIVLNDKKAQGAEMLETGDNVKLYLSDETVEKFKSGHSGYSPLRKNIIKDILIYEDANVLIMNKPEGVLSQKAESSDISMVEQVIDYLIKTQVLTPKDLETFKPGICNRLDRNTTGLIAAGVSLPGLQKMNELFKERTLEKYYLCLSVGMVSESMNIHGYLTKNEKTNKVSIGRYGDNPIETAYEPVLTCDEYSLLKVHLITGKTHQIRAHLASIGHPVIGDYKYGNREINRIFKTRYNITSQLLHSYELVLPHIEGELHNLSGKTFKAVLPDKFRKAIGDIKWLHGTPEDLEVLR